MVGKRKMERGLSARLGQIRAVFGVQTAQHRIVSALRLLLQAPSGLLRHRREVGAVEIALGHQRLAGRSARSADRPAAHQDQGGQQEYRGPPHGSSEII